MKKRFIAFVLTVLLLLPLSAAAEPLVMLSLAVPALAAAENPGGIVDVSQLDKDSTVLLVMPEEIKRSGMTLKGIASGRILSMLEEAVRGALFYSGVEDIVIIGAEGTISSQLNVDKVDEGIAAADVTFDDVSVLYRFGSRGSSAALDGTMSIAISLFSDPLVSLFIDTGDVRLSGDDTFIGNEVEIRLNINSSAVYSYLSLSGHSLKEAREAVFRLIALYLGDRDESLIGVDLSASDYDDIISVLDELNLTDVLDFAAFIVAADGDPAIDTASMITMAIQPSIYLNGEAIPGVDLNRLKDFLMDAYSMVSDVRT